MNLSESELILMAQQGDTEAFCLLARGYERRIYTLALYYCRDTHDAEDLAQEAWLKAFKAIASFKGESSFYTWLRQITINAFLNHQRSLRKHLTQRAAEIRMIALDSVDYMEHLISSPANALEDGVQQKMLLEKVAQALDELTPQQRLIFLLKHEEGMTYEEISAALKCSTGTIKKSLFRAVAKLRQRLGIEPKAADYIACVAGENF